MKHDYAPGPWSVSGKTVKSICHQRHYAVARVDNKLFTEEANKANAVLIAAAPELLAALQTLTGFYSANDRHSKNEVSTVPYFGPKDSEVLGAWRVALSVIAKATGE